MVQRPFAQHHLQDHHHLQELEAEILGVWDRWVGWFETLQVSWGSELVSAVGFWRGRGWVCCRDDRVLASSSLEPDETFIVLRQWAFRAICEVLQTR